MTPRRALGFILVAGVGFILLLGLAFALQLMQPPAQMILTQIPVDTSAMPLDQNGIGSQTISGTQIVVRLSPYPARPHVSSTLRLVVTAPTTTTLQTVTPTLFLASQAIDDSSRVANLPMQREPDGSYLAQGNFFPTPGGWRLRIELMLDDDDPYSVIVLVNTGNE